MTTAKTDRAASKDSKAGATWKPVPGSEQDTHTQTPGGGEEAKHGTKASGDSDERAKPATSKGR